MKATYLVGTACIHRCGGLGAKGNTLDITIWTHIQKTQLLEHEAYKKLMFTDENYLYIKHSWWKALMCILCHSSPKLGVEVRN